LGIEPLDERVFDALASPASSMPGSVVPRICSASCGDNNAVFILSERGNTVATRGGVGSCPTAGGGI
jgi:hypothetical protein